MNYKQIEEEFKKAKGYEFNATDTTLLDWLLENYSLSRKVKDIEVGDRVKVISEEYILLDDGTLADGREGTVLEVKDQLQISIELDDYAEGSIDLSHFELELIEEPKIVPDDDFDLEIEVEKL